MIASDQWTELLTCSNCGMSGSARLSRPEKRAYDFSVEAIPTGFKVVRMEFGKIFFCEACNQPADTRSASASYVDWPVTLGSSAKCIPP
jgi:hypothetical protein